MKSGRGLRIPGPLWDVAYGWTAAMRLAKEDPEWMREDVMDEDKMRFPYQNADSIALFASGELKRDNIMIMDRRVLTDAKPRDCCATISTPRSLTKESWKLCHRFLVEMDLFPRCDIGVFRRLSKASSRDPEKDKATEPWRHSVVVSCEGCRSIGRRREPIASHQKTLCSIRFQVCLVSVARRGVVKVLLSHRAGRLTLP